MRIFFAVPRAAWVELNLKRSLLAMGHEVIPFTFPGWPDDADPAWQRRGKPRTNERLLHEFKKALSSGPVDLFFGYFYSSVVYPETIDAVRASGVPTVNFSCNNVHQFDLVEKIAPHFDLCVVPEKAALSSFAAVGARTVRIQLAANPEVYRPYPVPRAFDVAFVGQRYADRAELMCYLQRQGIDVRAWGAGWQTRKRPGIATLKAGAALIEDERWDGISRILRNRARTLLPQGRRPESDAHSVEGSEDRVSEEVVTFGGPRLLQDDLIKMFSRSHISLGFATAGDSHRGPRRLTHLRLREFEAPMSGALYLTEQQEELEEYFQPDEEVLTYSNREDLAEKASFYLRHPELAERVRRAGHLRAMKEHTWQHRFRDLFQVLGLSTGSR